jgi:hypothetical protein
MWAYSNAAFRVVVLGPRRFRLERGTLIIVTHRRETDVPVICPPLYFGARQWRYTDERMAFAARDDMFVPGFFAGFPKDLPPKARRLLFGLDVRRYLLGIGVYPISSATVARVGEILRAGPDAPLSDALPAHLADLLRVRSDELGLPPLERAQDALRGEYADLLWRQVSREDLSGPDGFWERRATQATSDFRRLIEVGCRQALMVFPEGRPSPDGEIGPLRRGLPALVRRVQPGWIFPVSLAYDPLVPGRTRVIVTLGPPRATPTNAVEESVLELLRTGTALTAGQHVAHELEHGREPSRPSLDDAVDAAQAERRPVDPELVDPERRAVRLEQALAEASRQPDELSFLAREYASARGV